jgi:hypothetical protein
VYSAVCSVVGALVGACVVGLAIGMVGVSAVRWPPLGRVMLPVCWQPGCLELMASVDMGRKTSVVGTTTLFWLWARLAWVSKISVMGVERTGRRGTTPRPHGGK